MAIIFGNIVFLHTPKTGGVWLRNALALANPEAYLEFTGPGGYRHSGLEKMAAFQQSRALAPGCQVRDHQQRIVDVGASGPLRQFFEAPLYAAFIRHPVSWWISFWRYRQTVGWDYNNEIDIDCRADDFNSFIRNVIRLRRGACSYIFREFIGQGQLTAHFVGMHEHLLEDLFFILEHGAAAFDASVIENLQKLNVSRAEIPFLASDLAAELSRAEANIIDEYYAAGSLPLAERSQKESAPNAAG